MIEKLTDHLPHISCREATKLISDSMERRLSLKEVILLKIHLGVCELCRRFKKQIKSLRILMRSYSPEKENVLPETWKNDLRKILNEQP